MMEMEKTFPEKGNDKEDLMEILVGYTGFVGSNLMRSHDFKGKFNSRNIGEAFGTEPDLLVYSGVRAEKFLANRDPEADLENIRAAIDNISRIHPKKLVLISTIDVYRDPAGAYEDTAIEEEGLHPYGLNRYRLETWVRENVEDHLIVRLPGLYGENLKKNFIYDMIHVIPSMLSEAKYRELEAEDDAISAYFTRLENGFYKCRELDEASRAELKAYFLESGFTALNFTDSRGRFQFYDLSLLFGHIETALRNGLKVLNLAVEPVTAAEVYQHVRGGIFKNEVAKNIPDYDFRSRHAHLFGGEAGYLIRKDDVLEGIRRYVEGAEA